MKKDYGFRDNPNLFNYKILKVKWILKDIFDVIITENLEIWQLPYQSGLRYFKYRQIKPEYHQGQVKIRIKGKRYTRNDIIKMRVQKEFEIKTNILE